MYNCTLYMLNNLTPLFTITHLFSTVFRLGPKPAHILAHLWSFQRLLALFLQWIWKDLQIRSSLFQWACWWINHLPAIEISHHRAGSAAAIRSWIRCLWLTSLPKTDSYHAAKICQVSKLVAFLLPCASSGCCEQKNLGFEDVLPWPKLIFFWFTSQKNLLDLWVPKLLTNGRYPTWQRAFRWLSCRKAPAQKKNCQHLRPSSR